MLTPQSHTLQAGTPGTDDDEGAGQILELDRDMSRVESDSFQVEAILDDKKPRNKERLYFIKWVGYGDDENTWEKESLLLEDGLGDVVDAYKKEKKERKKREREAKKKNPAKSRRGRTKSPGNSTKGKKLKKEKTPKKESKKSPTPKKSSAKKKATKSPRSKTPPRASKSSPDARSPAVEDAASMQATIEENFKVKHEEAFSQVQTFLWWGVFLIFACSHVLLTVLFHENADENEAWVKFLKIARSITACLPALIALSGLVAHPNSSRSLPKYLSVSIVWFAAVEILRQLSAWGFDSDQELMRLVTLGAGCVARIFACIGFQSSEQFGSSGPSISLIRVLPFGILVYFIVNELSLSGGPLEKVSGGDITPATALFGIIIITSGLAGWRSAARVGYGDIGWRSRRATKQIIGVVACLVMMFALMIDFEGTQVLRIPILASGKYANMRSTYRLCAEWLTVGLLATSALMHCVDEE